ncbi:MAG TPA: hypothetical protein VHI71_10060 [Actinomycetota bacterium]|nr:hypothetical protein [Actinomycetota bacterium]
MDDGTLVGAGSDSPSPDDPSIHGGNEPILEDVARPQIGAVVIEREKTRRALALRVFWFMVGTIGVLIGAVLGGWRTWSEVEGLAASVLPLVSGFVGSVFGFYFAVERRGS